MFNISLSFHNKKDATSFDQKYVHLKELYGAMFFNLCILEQVMEIADFSAEYI